MVGEGVFAAACGAESCYVVLDSLDFLAFCLSLPAAGLAGMYCCTRVILGTRGAGACVCICIHVYVGMHVHVCTICGDQNLMLFVFPNCLLPHLPMLCVLCCAFMCVCMHACSGTHVGVHM